MSESLIDKMRDYSDFVNRITYFLPLDNSTQEELFLLWVDEAIVLGIIEKFIPEDKMDSFIIFDELSYPYTEEKYIYPGTKREELVLVKKKDKLLSQTKYTPDGLIVWNPKVKNILFNDLFEKGNAYFKAQFLDNKWITLLDVKAPKGVNRASDLPFSFTRRMMWTSHNLYVNKVMNIPPKPKDEGYLYSSVWTPLRYTLTDKMTKQRTLHYKVKTVEQFMVEFKI